MNAYQKISCLLLIGVALYMGGKAFANWLARRDAEWAAKNPPLFPSELNDAGPVPPVSARDKEIAAVHVAKLDPAFQRAGSPTVGGIMWDFGYPAFTPSEKKRIDAAIEALPASLRTPLPYIRKAERYATSAESEGGNHD